MCAHASLVRGIANLMNPFSFRGEMGRAQFWLTVFVLEILGTLSAAFPVDYHELVAKNPMGEATAGYVTPLEPVTLWTVGCFVLVVILWLLIFWIFAAAVVQRLNDLGVSWKWAAGFLAGFVAGMIWEFAFAHTDPNITPFDVIGLILWFPVCLVGAMGMFMICFLPGYRSRHDALPDNDLRKGVI